MFSIMESICCLTELCGGDIHILLHREQLHVSALDSDHLQVYMNHLISSYIYMGCLYDFGATAPQWARTSSFTRFLDHTQRRTAVGRTPLDVWSARHRDLYLTTHNTHNRQPMHPVGFELEIPTSEWPQTDALDRAAAGTGANTLTAIKYILTVQ